MGLNHNKINIIFVLMKSVRLKKRESKKMHYKIKLKDDKNV